MENLCPFCAGAKSEKYMNTRPRVLLTASYGPYELGWGEDMHDLMGSRLARGHGAFRIKHHMHYFGLHLIAENITNPTTVLEHPHWDEFVRELDQGYDIVGFQLESLHTHKIARMMKHIRDRYPKTTIVVGGYGVGTLERPVPGDVDGDAVYIRENADCLCREEGVGFMRRILDDQPVQREITQYQLPMTGLIPPGVDRDPVKMPTVLVALGCPNACDFCNTSAFFRHKKVYVAQPEQVYRFIKNFQRRLGQQDIFVNLFDEDFFLNSDYVRELGRLLRNDKQTWAVRWHAFGSLRSLSAFSPEEVRDCGCGAVWIGVESFQCAGGLADEPYAKRTGAKIEDVIAGLQQHGVQITASMVLGFDFHNRENLKQDIDQFVALKPMFYQVAPLLPCPGTPLYDRLLEESRILDTYRWQDLHMCSGELYQPKNFDKGEIKQFFDYAHQQLRDRNGPAPLQMMENALDSYRRLKNAADAFGIYQAQASRKAASGLFSFLRAVRAHHPSPVVRQRAAMLERRYREEIGRPPLTSQVISHYISRNIEKRLSAPEVSVASDPSPRWTYYHTFDERVWVRKGRKASRPAVYEDRKSRFLSPFLRTGRVKPIMPARLFG